MLPEVNDVLNRFPDDCTPQRIEAIDGAGGFSGSRIWRIESRRGDLCLRQWTPEHPSPQRLEFIHTVLRHVAENGFRRLPLPISTRDGGTWVEHSGRLWELAPWMPGETDRSATTGTKRIAAATAALAQFHIAAMTFPVQGAHFGPSPGLIERNERLRRLLAGDLSEIERAIDERLWPELADRGRRFLRLFERAAPSVQSLLNDAIRLSAPWQVCLRDIWRENVLFVGDDVSAILDFAALRVDTVAGDLARLIGSFAGDDRIAWEQAVAAYREVRPLTPDEARLVTAFDRSAVLLTGISWLDRVFRQRREFSNRRAVVGRFDFALARLESLPP